MNSYGNPPSRNQAKAAGVKSNVSVSAKGNGPVSGNKTSGANTGNGHTPGSAVKGHAGSAVKGGFVKA